MGSTYTKSIRTVQRVWAAVTRTPCASVRELACASGLTYGHTSGILRLLRDAGYIDFAPASARARTIVVPFIVAAPTVAESDYEGADTAPTIEPYYIRA